MFPRRYKQAGFVALLFACMLISGSTSTSIDSNAFMDAGCFAEDYGLNCSSLGLVERFGCMQIYNASSSLDNLSPRLPIVECLILSADYHSQEGIVREGCMMPVYRRYIALQGEDFRLISSKEEFLSLFAPVETKEEALAFAVALTSSLPRYDNTVPKDYFPVKPSIRPTYVEETTEGFKVHLFDSELCGCGSHPYYAIEYLVTREGNVTELSREKAYDSTIQICVD
ncbi:MAG: hypothetical protein JW999_02695 [Methanotrichaceae archaeon]|nr:hypothetical protein [Methanotrichaceae archaeon]